MSTSMASTMTQTMGTAKTVTMTTTATPMPTTRTTAWSPLGTTSAHGAPPWPTALASSPPPRSHHRVPRQSHPATTLRITTPDAPTQFHSYRGTTQRQ